MTSRSKEYKNVSNAYLLQLQKDEKTHPNATAYGKKQLKQEIAYRKEHGLMKKDAGKPKKKSNNPFGFNLW